MTTVITPFVTIVCDGPNCDKSVTFKQTEEDQKIAEKENLWLGFMRFVNTLDGRKLGYCSDVCEAEAVQAGSHNKPEPKKIFLGNEQEAQLAAQAAAHAAKAQAAIRAGQPITLG